MYYAVTIFFLKFCYSKKHAIYSTEYKTIPNFLIDKTARALFSFSPPNVKHQIIAFTHFYARATAKITKLNKVLLLILLDNYWYLRQRFPNCLEQSILCTIKNGILFPV